MSPAIKSATTLIALLLAVSSELSGTPYSATYSDVCSSTRALHPKHTITRPHRPSSTTRTAKLVLQENDVQAPPS